MLTTNYSMKVNGNNYINTFLLLLIIIVIYKTYSLAIDIDELKYPFYSYPIFNLGINNLNRLVYLLINISIVLVSLGVVFSRHILHSLLYLIITFFLSSLILIFLKTEFFGLVFLIIYLGAITILFIFIIMMLNIRLIEFNYNLIKYLPIGTLLTIVLLIELVLFINNETTSTLNGIYCNLFSEKVIYWTTILTTSSTIKSIGILIYLYFWVLFLNCALILLIAMIGSIVITNTITSKLHEPIKLKKMLNELKRKLVELRISQQTMIFIIISFIISVNILIFQINNF